MINNVSSLMPGPAGAAHSKAKDSPEKIKDAAQQFEALMISQFLKTARETSSSGGWLGTGEDETGQIPMDLAEQQLAMTMAKQGGFGLTKTITRDLEQRLGQHVEQHIEKHGAASSSKDPAHAVNANDLNMHGLNVNGVKTRLGALGK